MNDIGKWKRETQRRVIALFRDEPKTEQPERVRRLRSVVVIASKVAMDEPPKAVEDFAPVVIGMNAGPDKVFPADTTCPFSKNLL